MKVTGPYRAEHRRKKATGAWRDNIEEAMADAKLLGSGATVVSSERVLLAKFETAMKFAPQENHQAGPGPGTPRPHKALNGNDDEPLSDPDEPDEEEDEPDETNDLDE